MKPIVPQPHRLKFQHNLQHMEETNLSAYQIYTEQQVSNDFQVDKLSNRNFLR